MSLLNKITKSRRTIIDMLELRGFNTENYVNFSSEELNVMVKTLDKKLSYEIMPIDMVVEHKEIEGKKCVVKYVHSQFRKLSKISIFVKEMIENGIVDENDDLVFIVNDKINNIETFYALFDQLYLSDKVFVQLFDLNKLLINITKHELVPKMRIVSEEEKLQVKEKYNVENMSNFPIILSYDPVAQFYGVKKGDLCEIIRKSETSGEYKAYRYCQ
tara:strand:+ start:35 stop:682 length:648 start_codon:yes stop_codon:yes gene_type:complete